MGISNWCVSGAGEVFEGRKGRELSLEEIEHYMKVAAAIRRTIEVQRTIDQIIGRI